MRISKKEEEYSIYVYWQKNIVYMCMSKKKKNI
jgi:hypothetical protein